MSHLNLQSLPNDVHYALAEFLTGDDLVALSQVSKPLRELCNPFSFTYSQASPLRKLSDCSPPTRSRPVPAGALISPAKYASWFRPQSLLHLAIPQPLLESLPDLAQACTLQNLPALVAIWLLPPNSSPTLSPLALVPFANSFSPSSLPPIIAAAPLRISPSQPLPVLQLPSVASLPTSSLASPAAFAHIAHIALDLGWSQSNLSSFIPSSKHLRSLALKAIDPALFAHLLAQTPTCWPNLHTLRIALLVCWQRENIRIEAAVQHIPNIPNSVPNVVLTLDPLHDDDTQIPPLMLDFDRSAQLPDNQIVRAPAVSQVIMNECIGTKGDATPFPTSSSNNPSRRNAIEFPGLRTLHLTLGVPWNRMSTAACSAHTLTTLYLRTNPNSHKLHQECLFWLLDDFREFVNLQRLAISFASSGSVKGNPLADFSPYFAHIRNHYESSNVPPHKKWLTAVLNSSVDWTARPTLADWLQSLLISFACKPDRAVVMMLPMFRMLASSPDEFRAMTRTFLLEAFADKCLHGLPRLEYLAVDFGTDVGVISPGITRLVNYHTGLKQILVQERLLDGHSMVFQHSQPHMATVLGRQSDVLLAQTVVDMDCKRSFPQPFFTKLPATESSFCSQSNLFVQNFTSVFFNESFSGWL